MKRKLSLFILFLGASVVCSSSIYAQRNQTLRSRTEANSTRQTTAPRTNAQNSERPPLPEFMTEDGKVDLSKLPENFSDEMREQWTKADKDGDGFLDEEERQAVFGNRGGFPGGPGGFGQNGLTEMARGVFDDDDQFVFEKFNEAFAEFLKKADEDGDGFLSKEELQKVGLASQSRTQRSGFMTEDGKIDLSKLPENFSDEMREQWTKADKDGDGFLNEEERQTVFSNRGGFPGMGGPGMGGPGMGNMQRPNFMTEDGKIDLSKLPENFSDEMREQWAKADKDGDGFLNEEERQTVFGNRGGFPGMGGPGMGRSGMGGPGMGNMQRPNFMTEDGKIDLSKLPENMPADMLKSMKAADKNKDGFLNEKEQTAQREKMMKQQGGNANQRGNARNNQQDSNRRTAQGDRPAPPSRNGEAGPGMPPGGMNGMLVVRFVSTQVRETVGDADSVKIADVEKAIEKALEKADSNDDELLDEEELQKLRDSLPRMGGFGFGGPGMGGPGFGGPGMGGPGFGGPGMGGPAGQYPENGQTPSNRRNSNRSRN